MQSSEGDLNALCDLVRDMAGRFERFEHQLEGVTRNFQDQLDEVRRQVDLVMERQEMTFHQRLDQLAALPTPSLVSEDLSPPRTPNVTAEAGRDCASEDHGDRAPAFDSRPLNEREAGQPELPFAETSLANGLTPQRRNTNPFWDDILLPEPELTQVAHVNPDAESTRRILEGHTFIIERLRRDVQRLISSNTRETTSSPPPENSTEATRSTALFPPVKLMYYDGSFPWEQFKVHLDTTIRANAWSENVAGIQLVAKLRGKALQVVSILDEARRNNYRSLLDVLATRFGDKRDDNAARCELQRRVQKPSEDLETFAMEVEYLTQRAYPSWPSDVVEKLAMLQFLNGIADAETQLHVRTSSPTSIKAACEVGLKFIRDRTATRANQRHLRTAAANVDLDQHRAAHTSHSQSPSSFRVPDLPPPQATPPPPSDKPSGNGTGSA